MKKCKDEIDRFDCFSFKGLCWLTAGLLIMLRWLGWLIPTSIEKTLVAPFVFLGWIKEKYFEN